jgi:hypothetical protein
MINCVVEVVDYESSLIQADWYEEHGEVEAAEQIRDRNSLYIGTRVEAKRSRSKSRSWSWSRSRSWSRSWSWSGSWSRSWSRSGSRSWSRSG